MGDFSPYILQAAFKDIPGEVMARALDDLGFAVSTGSACSSSSPERPVLEAMGVEENLRIEGIRISQGFNTTDEEIELLIKAISEVLTFL
jgi:cysteine desulfurase